VFDRCVEPPFRDRPGTSPARFPAGEYAINLRSRHDARITACLTAIVLLVSTLVQAQSVPPDLKKMTIEQLLEVEVTSTASKFEQEVTRAPASVTVVTHEEILLHGYRTLAEILGSVRGLYTTYDRNYTYVGVRGFARPGDYNTRVLLLIDGHRLNEPTYDMAPIGTDFPLDVSLIDRVEIIRGPGSSLYGTSAFFAVINVLTRSGASHAGRRVDTSVGSLTTGQVTASYGHAFDSGKEMLLAASGYGSAGDTQLYYPEYDSPETGNGIAIDADGDRAASVFASVALGSVRVSGGFLDRQKHIPTAAWDSVFGDRRARTEDTRAYADATYTGPMFSGWTSVARAGLNFYEYVGTYPLDFGADGTVVQNDGSHSVQVSGELTLNRRWRQHAFTVGGEVRRTIQDSQWVQDVGPRWTAHQLSSTPLGVYAQDEVTIRPWMLVNGGVRLDYDNAFGGSATPRVGVVFLPRRQSALKLLYGRAFRAPNSYELYYFDAMREQGITLSPETIDTTELVWEEYIGPYLRATASLFSYDARNLIAQRSLDGTSSGDSLHFANADRTTARGVDAELEGRWNDLTVRMSYANVNATDWASRERLSNSPQHLGKAALLLPIKALATSLALDGRFTGARRSLDGGAISGFVLANVTATTALGKALDLQFGLYNALNQVYSDPGAEEHLQRAILQDGRTLRVRLMARF
jgi:iron complex outermembrane receptor protein